MAETPGKDLPGPLDVSGRIFVAVQDESAGGTDMGPEGETLLHPRATAATILGGVGKWDRDDSTASVCGFAVEDGAELGPARVVDRRVQTSLRTGPVVLVPTVAVRLRLGAAAQVVAIIAVGLCQMAAVECILIVGAGIGGLTAATALRKQGFQPELVVRSLEWPATGAAIQLHGNAMYVLHTFCVGEAV